MLGGAGAVILEAAGQTDALEDGDHQLTLFEADRELQRLLAGLLCLAAAAHEYERPREVRDVHLQHGDVAETRRLLLVSPARIEIAAPVPSQAGDGRVQAVDQHERVGVLRGLGPAARGVEYFVLSGHAERALLMLINVT